MAILAGKNWTFLFVLFLLFLQTTNVFAALGETSIEAAVSCKHIKSARPAAIDDIYWVDTDGVGGATATSRIG